MQTGLKTIHIFFKPLISKRCHFSIHFCKINLVNAWMPEWLPSLSNQHYSIVVYQTGM